MMKNVLIIVVQFILHPVLFLKKGRVFKDFLKSVEGNASEILLLVLLEAMSIALCFSRSFRENIHLFTARYSFLDKENGISAGASFNGGRMRVHNEVLENSDATVTFKDAKTMRDFLFSKKPDIISALLNNEITVTGNLNYLFKFSYMARNLQGRLSRESNSGF